MGFTSFNPTPFGLSTRIIRGDAPYAPAHYKGGNKPGFGITALRRDRPRSHSLIPIQTDAI
ncbi:MAG: hypothetical protein HC789_04840 [Microcoleus sp. CSU_2_2]|nr:hypothetical protein [Microcoleus sp. CSU_2_2]